MPRGDKSAYTAKQRRQAEHIEESYESQGVPKKEAERRAWATENKMSGGGRKSGSGRGKTTSKRASQPKKSSTRTAASRSKKSASGKTASGSKKGASGKTSSGSRARKSTRGRK
ncbi:MAG: plasmid stabilization protein [Gemmatimonadota bacterium]|nr:plasmid stabilization protein [Gemmatimonadota bacterium]